MNILFLIIIWYVYQLLSSLVYLSKMKSDKLIISLQFLWFDNWIGTFYDAKKRILYFCPLPFVVIKVGEK